MAKADLNATFDYIRGAIGGIVFKRVRGKTILTKKPVFKKPPSAAQLAQRQRFREATDYAKRAQADPVLRPLYEPVARKRQVAVFTVALRDFLNAPSIRCLYLQFYQGKPGDSIGIHATDDFGLAELEVSLITLDGTLVERGEAGLHSGSWSYRTTVEVAHGSRLRLEVAGSDYAGNRVRAAEEIIVGETRRVDVKAQTGALRAASEPLPQQPALSSEVLEPVVEESEGAVPEADQAAVGTADFPEALCISQREEAVASPGIREQDPAGEQDHAPDCIPAEVALPALAGGGHALPDVPEERPAVPMLWWALLAAVRLRHEAAVERLCELRIPGEAQDAVRHAGSIVRRALDPPPGGR